jgi:predicted ribosome quality control (RQC) complex YloA/Tae2 family protein
MHFDALTLACLTDELRHTLLGGRVQQVMMIDDDHVGMEVYATRMRHYLVLAADRTASYAYLSSQKLRRGTDAQPPLLLLLRKYVRGARLVDINQLEPTERVLRLGFEHPQTGATWLIFEPMGRMANLILTTPQGRILDCLHRVPASKAKRALMPGQPYAAPPPVAKLPPLDDGRPDYYAELGAITQAEGKLWRALVDQIAGVSPTQARELAWRIAGSADAPAQSADTLKLSSALQSLWRPVAEGGWTPGLAEEAGSVVAFAPYELHYRGEFMPMPSLSSTLERFHAVSKLVDEASNVAAAAPDPYAAQRADMLNRLRQARKRLDRQLSALAADEPAPGEPDELRRNAEWLLALGSQLEPNAPVLEVDLGEEKLTIPRTPGKSAVEQAEQMFKRASKLERAAKFIPRRRTQLQADLDFVDQLIVDVREAENQPEIAAVGHELEKLGLTRRHKSSKGGRQPTGGPRRFESTSGYEILVGRNAQQNEQVSFGHARAEDLWLHARGAPGSHVVIRRRGSDPDEATIEAAAQLAAYYSSLRGERNAPVSLTQCRFVSRAASGRPGQVTIRNDRTVVVPAEVPVSVTEVTDE